MERRGSSSTPTASCWSCRRSAAALRDRARDRVGGLARRDRRSAARAGLPWWSCSTRTARGYICENYGARFSLPGRGPIGANCMANPRDFKAPGGGLRGPRGDLDAALQVVRLVLRDRRSGTARSTSWRGTATTRLTSMISCTYSPVGAILFDHPDPSIFTVHDRPVRGVRRGQHRLRDLPRSLARGRALVSPALVSSNIMSEFMGLIHGSTTPSRRASCRAAEPAQHDAAPRSRKAHYERASPPSSRRRSWPTRCRSCSRRGFPSI